MTILTAEARALLESDALVLTVAGGASSDAGNVLRGHSGGETRL